MQPVLPKSLASLGTLARNLRWSWDQPTQQLFRSIDPDLWEASRDPIKLLSRVSGNRLQTLSTDRRFLRNLSVVVGDLEDYLRADLWYQTYAAKTTDAPASIGYFSAEFGVNETLPQYSGGLGILAGDHLKGASDLGVPIVGVGLLYRHGYFRQALNAAGWQQETYPVLDPNDLPVRRLRDEAGEPVLIEVPLFDQPLYAHVWLADVGRVPLLMLDAAIDENSESDRLITDRLYGGGEGHRFAQEVLLGVGGVRALREYCRLTGTPEPPVYHCNEGHAGFLGLERVREYMATGMDFDTAVEVTRAGNVFTTHTPVPAGIDRFPKELVARQFANFGLPLDRILAQGTEDYPGGDPSRFNMAVMGLRLGQWANGVSELHGEVSRRMFQGLWPSFDTTEVPITSVTNGVHHRTWIHPELLELLEVSTGDDEDTVIDGYDWAALNRVDDNTLWALKRQMRGSMIAMARTRLTDSCRARGINADWVPGALSAHTLTLGFARRGASYKRLTLMLKEPERLKALLNHPETPIQIVIAGKSHPADDIGKALIQQMVQFAEQDDVRGRIVFLPDYDMSMARPLYPGCDVWINNPLRPYEACGTSGMKAALNGAANLSIRDGWWDEWFDPAWGWEIPSFEGIDDPDQRDAAEAHAFYEVLETEVIPRFYERDAHGLPTRWLQMIRDTISGLGPRILASRMVRDYVTRMYTPAAVAHARVTTGRTAAELAAWKSRVRAGWHGVRVASPVGRMGSEVQAGQDLDFAVAVYLGSLLPEDVEVELVTGDVNGGDELHNIRIQPMTEYTELEDGGLRYETSMQAEFPGSLGYTVRVVPKHALLNSVAEMGLATVPDDTVPA